MHIEPRKFASVEDLNAAAVDCLSAEFSREHRTPAAVMLSGGNTPLTVYGQLCRKRVKATSALSVFYSDDRHVPPGSPDSNYGQSRPLLDYLDLPEERVIRVHTELTLSEAAARYARDLDQFLAGGGRVTLGLLGLGADGHTASLFTPDDVERGRGHWAVAVPRPQKPDRVSVTPDLLCRIERLVMLAPGSGKKAIVERLLRAPQEVVAGLALHNRTTVEIWFD